MNLVANNSQNAREPKCKLETLSSPQSTLASFSVVITGHMATMLMVVMVKMMPAFAPSRQSQIAFRVRWGIPCGRLHYTRGEHHRFHTQVDPKGNTAIPRAAGLLRRSQYAMREIPKRSNVQGLFVKSHAVHLQHGIWNSATPSVQCVIFS